MSLPDSELKFVNWLLGWKPERCEGTIEHGSGGQVTCLKCGSYLGSSEHLDWDQDLDTAHDIPPPDLTSDALYKAIIEGLNKRGYVVEFWPENSWTTPVSCILASEVGARGIDAPTLLDAARAAYERENS